MSDPSKASLRTHPKIISLKNTIISTLSMYSDTASGYNELHGEEQKKKIEIILKNLELKKDDLLLDIGVGTGLALEALKGKCRCIGIEPCKELIEQANPEIKEKITEAKAESIPFGDNKFDIIISVTAIHNFDNTDKAIEEIKRVAKPKAQIIITILKKSQKADEIKRKLVKNFMLRREIGEDKDYILIMRKR